MRVNMKSLINQLDGLKERLDELSDKLEKLEDLDYDIAVEDVQQYILPGDTFNLTIATSVLEQADKLDKALEIIKRLPIDYITLLITFIRSFPDDCFYDFIGWGGDETPVLINEEEYDLLKEVLL